MMSFATCETQSLPLNSFTDGLPQVHQRLPESCDACLHFLSARAADRVGSGRLQKKSSAPKK